MVPHSTHCGILAYIGCNKVPACLNNAAGKKLEDDARGRANPSRWLSATRFTDLPNWPLRLEAQPYQRRKVAQLTHNPGSSVAGGVAVLGTHCQVSLFPRVTTRRRRKASA